MVSFRHRTDRRIALLKDVELLTGCTTSELRRIASLTTESTRPAGETLARQDEPGSEMLIFVEGTALASRRGCCSVVLESPQCFVELALLDGGRRTATITAETDLHLLVLSRREFKSLYSSFPSVAHRILLEFADRLRRADELRDRMVVAGTRPVRPHLDPGRPPADMPHLWEALVS